ncbi:GGDEF domain-containing protein [Moritella viscosa]|uniref:PAS:GGDEF n=1 Tax=Moritella viscosa TaxID=80854 RepID=A0ABY1HFS9_9GAMM|nr:GGDEF domain-containing protein [Moritella viscosa]CED61691.1 putative membrane associated signaling protein, GGDEF family protein [Moritella viscosa]SGY90370.1 PAS:GGDEF [Moritella viscosa]SGY99470.1 PAS:GGDEF [Moritella viscosa]SHO06439.1 PAS:GGDEF [Moritella viscosa]SHO21676.1 PAS:GGDEF [Moritella viscosa]
MTFIKYAIFITLSLSFGISAFAVRAEHKTEHVRILLPPTSVVQSAGYYMAQHKGFFSAQSLNVDLTSTRSRQSVTQSVDQGEADYGVTNADVLVEKANGRALVAIAAIFQHSPNALLVLKNKGINKLSDLNDKRVLLLPEFKDIEVVSLLRKQNIDSINILSTSAARDITTLVHNQFDALSINLIRGPYNAVRQGAEPIIFMPKDYGIDFYSGFLFTSAAEASLNPERVAAVRTAVLQGWEYALTHTEETLDVLVALNQQLPSASLDVLRNQFKYQLITMRDYILPDFVPLGYINRQHLADIQQQLIDLNFISQGSDFSQFIYTPPRAKIDWKVWGVWVKVIAVALLFNGLWLFYLLVINQRLKREILERRRAEQQVRYAAMHDNLTGLANRTQLMETLEHILPLAKKGKITPVLLFMDLDRFKLVNDRYGHAAGDELLIAAAQRMSRLLGAPGELLTRLGGDEFVVLLPNSNLRYAGQLSEQIERTLLQSFALSVCNVSIGISIGYSVYHHNMSADELLTGADNQMYEIKNEHHQKRKQIVC